MMQQLSPQAEQAVRLAHEIAREYRKDYVSTEHLLLAFARQGEGAAYDYLQAHGLDEDRLRKRLRMLIGAQMEETWVFGRLPGTPHFKRVMERAIEHAERAGAARIGTAALLAGILEEVGSLGQRVLTAEGIDADLATSELLTAED